MESYTTNGGYICLISIKMLVFENALTFVSSLDAEIVWWLGFNHYIGFFLKHIDLFLQTKKMNNFTP